MIFKNFEVFENLKTEISKFSKMHSGNLSQTDLKNMRLLDKSPEPKCGYWLITPSQQTLCVETNIFKQRAITKHLDYNKPCDYKHNVNCIVISM